MTAEYATYVIVLSRLTRIYERKDVKQALSKVTKKLAMRRVMPRGRKQKNNEKPRDEIIQLAEDKDTIIDMAAATATSADVSAPQTGSNKPKRPIVVKPIGLIQ